MILPALFLILNLSTGITAQVIIRFLLWNSNAVEVAEIIPILAMSNIGFLIFGAIALFFYVIITRKSTTTRSSDPSAGLLDGDKVLISWKFVIPAVIMPPLILYAMRSTTTAIAMAFFILAGWGILQFAATCKERRLMLPVEDKPLRRLQSGNKKPVPTWKVCMIEKTVKVTG